MPKYESKGLTHINDHGLVGGDDWKAGVLLDLLDHLNAVHIGSSYDDCVGFGMNGLAREVDHLLRRELALFIFPKATTDICHVHCVGPGVFQEYCRLWLISPTE